MTGMAERLTYLLGICVAVISWSVTQLSANLSNEDILAYSVDTAAADDRTDATTLHLENLGHSERVGRIIVSPEVNYLQSGQSPDCRGVSISYNPTLLAVKTSSDSNKGGFINVAVDGLLPGASLDVYIRHPHHCAVVPRVEAQPIENSQPRLLQFGGETWVIRHQFGIIITLIAIFGVIFAIAFASSLRIARNPT